MFSSRFMLFTTFLKKQIFPEGGGGGYMYVLESVSSINDIFTML